MHQPLSQTTSSPERTTSLPKSPPSAYLSLNSTINPSNRPSPATASLGHGSPTKRSPGRSHSVSTRSSLLSPEMSGLGISDGRGVEIGGLLQPIPQNGGPSAQRLRRSVSDEDTSGTHTTTTLSSAPQAGTSQSFRPPTIPIDKGVQSAFESARIKMSTKDREAMEKIRSTMSDSSSSTTSPLSPGFPNPMSRVASGSGSGSGSRGGIGVRPRKKMPAPEAGERRKPRSEHVDITSSPPLSSADFVIAVVGNPGVGKSTIIRRATKSWGVSLPVSIQSPGGHRVSSYFSHIPPNGIFQNDCVIEFLEMNIQALDLSGGATTIWPSFLAPISGVVVCYDAGDKDSLRGIKDVLQILAPSNIPTVMFATKSDPGLVPQVDALYGNSIGEAYNVGLIEVTTMSTDGRSKIKSGLRWLLLKLDQRQRRQSRKTSSSALVVNTTLDHTTISPTLPSAATATDSDASHGSQLMWRKGRPPRTSHKIGTAGERSSTQSSSSSLQWMMKGPLQGLHPAEGSENGNGNGDAEGEGSKVDKGQDSLRNGGSEEKVDIDGPEVKNSSPSDPPPYVSLSDLLNRLFTAMVSTQDATFIRAFFLTYRRFCKPSELMGEFLARFQEVEKYAVSKDVRHWALQKMTGGLIDWTSRYPGDLQTEDTVPMFREILALIFKYAFMAHLTVDLIGVEEGLSEGVDIDTSWSMKTKITDDSGPTISTSELVLDPSALYEIDSEKRSDHQTPSIKSLSISTSSLNISQADFDSGNANGGDPVARERSTSDPKLRGTTSEGSKSVHSDDLSSGFEQSRWSQPTHCINTYDPRYFAIELTRMTWTLFSEIRPRDVFRHDFGKEQDDPVGRSIMFFNHLSRWVSTMILANPKPKHRASVYGSFMAIAHQLRRLNNYDSLYAVISGMRETSVHRLGLTHQLVKVTPSLEKEFQSHLKLMDPRGGYVHYRRALQANLSHGRPTIPLMTTILSQISRLNLVRPIDKRSEDGMIQWDKFARFNDILSTIAECQSKGPIVPGPASPPFRQLIEDTPIIEHEDGLFERSRMLEPGGQTGSSGGVLRRLVNLGK